MADNNSLFDLGIENSVVYGNLKDAEAFLSDTSEEGEEEIVKTIKPIIPLVKESKKEGEKKDDEEEEVSPINLVNDFLGDEEDDDEEEIESEEKPLKKKSIKDAATESLNNEEDDEEANQFEILSKELYSNGVFTTEEGEEAILATTPEEFLQKFNEEKQKGATTWIENYLARFGDDRKDLFEAIFINGVEPKDYIPQSVDLEDYQSIDLESESNQESIVRSYYKQSGWSEEKISSKIQKLKNTADLEDEAKTIHPIIVEQRKDKLRAISEQKAAEQQDNIAKDTEYKTNLSRLLQDKVKDKNFNGIPFSEKEASKAFDFLYAKKWKTKSGELLTDYDKFILDTKNPDNLPKRIQIALLAMNNFDFSKIEKKAISKESGKLFSELVIKKAKKSNTQQAQKSNTWG